MWCYFYLNDIYVRLFHVVSGILYESLSHLISHYNAPTASLITTLEIGIGWQFDAMDIINIAIEISQQLFSILYCRPLCGVRSSIVDHWYYVNEKMTTTLIMHSGDISLAYGTQTVFEVMFNKTELYNERSQW